MPAVKYETSSECNSVGVASAERAFLTVWAGLGSWHSDLVLVGGLVPKCLCGDHSLGRTQHGSIPLDAGWIFWVHLRRPLVGAFARLLGSLLVGIQRWRAQAHRIQVEP